MLVGGFKPSGRVGGAHSEKPTEIHARIERLVAGPYVELFARKPVPGWDAWGNEVGVEAADG